MNILFLTMYKMVDINENAQALQRLAERPGTQT